MLTRPASAARRPEGEAPRRCDPEASTALRAHARLPYPLPRFAGRGQTVAWTRAPGSIEHGFHDRWVLAVVGCAHNPPPAHPIAPPTAAELPPPDAIPGTFAVRQKLTATSAKGGRQLRGGAAEDAGDADAGRAHAVWLARVPAHSRRRATCSSPSTCRATCRSPPTFMLLDIHRVLEQWLGALLSRPANARARSATRPSMSAGGTESLIERTFMSAKSTPPGTITISYAGNTRRVRFRDAHHASECASRLPDRHRHRAHSSDVVM